MSLRRGVGIHALVLFCLLAMPAMNAAAQTATGLTATPAPGEAVLFGPQKYVRTTGAKNEYTAIVNVPAWVKSPYRMHIQNGGRDGNNRIVDAISSAWIEVNGVQVAGPSDFNQHTAAINRTVTLTPTTTLKVTLASSPGSYLTIWFFGTGGDKTAPSVNIVEPLASSISNDATPALRVQYNDAAGSGVDATTLRVTIDDVDRTSLFTKNSTGATAVLPATLALADGLHTLRASIRDLAGNTGEASAQFRIDTRAPVVRITQPPANAYLKGAVIDITGTVTDDTSVVVDVNDNPGILNGNIFTARVPGVDGSLLLRATARDAAGNVGTSEVTVNVDSAPPVISVSEPAENLVTNQAKIRLSGTVTDASPVTLKLDGAPLPVNGAAFQSDLHITTEGTNTFTLAATDAAGNNSQRKIEITSDVTPPLLEIASPLSEAVIGNLPLVVRGLVRDRSATSVAVNGNSAESAQEAWEASLGSLPEGANSFNVVATDAAGNKTTLARSVTLDTTPPVVSLLSPLPGALTRQSSINVTGVVSDLTLASVVLGGLQATFQPTGNNSTAYAFTIANVPLRDGDNHLRVVATDNAGRAGEATVVLTQDAIAPVLTLAVPEVITRGRGGRALVTAADNLGVAQVVIKLNGTAIGSFNAPPFEANIAVPPGATTGDLLTVAAEATDHAGNTAIATQQMRVIADGVVVGQVLSDATGLPLAGARVRVAGSADREAITDQRGRYSLPATESRLVLTIEKEPLTGGSLMTSVERDVKIESGVGTVPVDARLTPLAAPVAVNPSGATLSADPVTITVNANAVSESASFRLTKLSAQGLPGLLPLGWSPLVAFDVRADRPVSAPLPATITKLPGGIQHLAVYRPTVHGWVMTTRDLTAVGGALSVELPGAGTYALVAADTHDPSLVVPPVGQVLGGLEMKTLPDAATSMSEVSPAILPPGGGTARGKLAIKSPTPLPSGTVVQTEVTETFSLNTGEVASQEKRSQDIILYRLNVPEGATLAAEFPIVPARTFTASELVKGTVHLDILAGREHARGKTGGNEAVALTSGNAALSVAGGSLPQDTAVSIQSTILSAFLPNAVGLVPFAEVLVDFSTNQLRLPGELSVSAENVPTGDSLLVARVERIEGIPRVVMVAPAQLQGGRVVSQNREGLPGIRREGRYVFYRSSAPLGFVAGAVSSQSGATADAVVRGDKLPFVNITSNDGRYMLPSLAGQATTLNAHVPATSLQGSASTTTSAGQTVELDILLAGVATTATVSPANGAAAVSVSSQIEITTTAPLNPASLPTANMKLFKGAAAANQTVALRPVLSGSGRVLALVPQARLEPAATYTLQATGLADIYGGTVSVPSVSFTTLADVAPVYDTNKLSFSFPDAQGNVRVKAPAGTFPAGTRLLIVNAGNGVVVSFTTNNEGVINGELPATIDDRLLITITDPLGNVTNFEQSKFVSEDGRTAIGPGGGVVEEAGGVELRIPEGALDKGATFQIETFGANLFPERPGLPNSHFGGGLKITAPDKPTFKKEVDIAFPKPAAAPPGAFFYIYRRIQFPDGKVGFETIDHAFVEGEGANAKVVTASPPFRGLKDSYGEAVLDTLSGNIGFIAHAVTYEYLMWTDLVYGPSIALPGLITGKVLRPKWNPARGEAEYEGIPGVMVYGRDADGHELQQGSPLSGNHATFAITQEDGTFSLWDAAYTGGQVTITASYRGVAKTATAFEANPLDTRTIFSEAIKLRQHYRNVAGANITFPAEEPPPPAPAVEVHVMQRTTDGKRRDAGGIVTQNTPLTIGFKVTRGNNVEVRTATINGQSHAVKVDYPTPEAQSLPMTYVLDEEFTPSAVGTYTVNATAISPTGGASITLSHTFVVVAAGGKTDKPIPNTPPDIITYLLSPKNGELGISIAALPQVTFTEPVTNVAANVRLQEMTGEVVPLTITAVAVGSQGEAVIIPDLAAQHPATPVTSITLRPTGGLKFNMQYKLVLQDGIQDLDKDALGNPTPRNLAARESVFTTLAPSEIGATDERFGSSGLVLVGDYAYVTRRRTVAPNGLMSVFKLTDSNSPVEIVSARQAVTGQPMDIALEPESPLTGGPLVGVGSGLAFLLSSPSNLYVFDAGEPETPKRIAVVSLTESSQEGAVLRLALKKSYAYALTYPKGIQVVDLRQARQTYQRDEASSEGRRQRILALVTSGVGYARDAIVNTIALPTRDGARIHQVAIAADEYLLDGSTQPLVITTGTLPFMLVNPFTSDTLYTGESILNLDGSLTFGRAIATGRAGDRNLVAIVGRGTARDANAPAGTLPSANEVLSLWDMANPRVPVPLAYVKLPHAPTDVVMSQERVLVGTANGGALIYNISTPNRPKYVGMIENVGPSLSASSASGLLLSTSGDEGIAGGVHVASFNPLLRIKPIEPVRVEVTQEGTMQQPQRVRALEEITIPLQIIPSVTASTGTVKIYKKGQTEPLFTLGASFNGGQATVTLPAFASFEDTDVLAVATAETSIGTMTSAPQRVKLGWVKLTVDANNNTVIDDEDDEAKIRGRAFAFWQSDWKSESGEVYGGKLDQLVTPGDAESFDESSKKLVDYATIRIRVNKHWWKSVANSQVQLRLTGATKWFLAEKVAGGKEYLAEPGGETEQVNAMIAPAQCGAGVPELKGECSSRPDLTIVLPDLTVGEHEFLLRCANCPADVQNPYDWKNLQVEFVGGGAPVIFDKAKVDLRPAEQWISVYSARRQEDTNKPTRFFNRNFQWSAIPDKAKTVTVLVHGFNVNEDDSLAFFKNFTKRLYWVGHPVLRRQGSDWKQAETDGCALNCAQVVGLSWPGNISVGLDATASIMFASAEERAFQAGVAGARFFSMLKDNHPARYVGVVAHSLGNLVVNNALKRPEIGGAFKVDKYIMYDSAVASEAFEEGEPDIPDAPDSLASRVHMWNQTFGNNLNRTQLYNAFNTHDLVLKLAFNGAHFLKPYLGKLETTLTAIDENPFISDDIWPNGENHANILKRWAELAYKIPSFGGPAGGKYLERLGSRNIDLSEFSASSFGASHSYLTARRFADVWRAFDIFKKTLVP